MYKRDIKLYINDIIDSANAIYDFIGEMSYEEFYSDRKTYSATLHEYIIIGEAISAIIDVLEDCFPDYPWRMVKDFRNLIVHEYFGVDARIVWDLTKHELDILVSYINQLDS